MWNVISSETVAIEDTTVLLEGIDNVHGGDGLALAMFSISEGIPHHFVQEIVNILSQLVMRFHGDSFHSSSSGQSTESSICDNCVWTFLASVSHCAFGLALGCKFSIFPSSCHRFDYKIYSLQTSLIWGIPHQFRIFFLLSWPTLHVLLTHSYDLPYNQCSSILLSFILDFISFLLAVLAQVGLFLIDSSANFDRDRPGGPRQKRSLVAGGDKQRERRGRSIVFIQKQNLNMSVLKLKMDKAAELFQTHQFKEALGAYEDALAFCYRTRESQNLIFNIMTTKAALQSILGEQDSAMSTLNEVLRTDPNHYLAMIRRSQVYKKKGKLNRALKDLESVGTFCPDNLQVAAMKIEIQTLRSKNKSSNSSDESESEDQVDEEIQLNFSNLKKIDRKSCSIMVDPLKRKSRVTISGDTAVQYQSEEQYDKSYSTSVSKQQSKEIYLQTFKEIQADLDTPTPAPKVIAKPNPRSKSILKNKQSSIIGNVPQQAPGPVYGGRESRFVECVKDIDGKMITSSRSIGSEKGIRQVEFRKSMFASQEKQFKAIEVPQKKKVQGGRKSCLKRSSFEQMERDAKEHPVRKSKFQTLGRNSIDGIVIKNRRSIDGIKEIQNDHIQKPDDESDEGSSYNIFGSRDNVEISKEIKEKLGLGKEAPKQSKGPAKLRAGGGKSILKKGSVLITTSEPAGKTSELKETSEEKKKPKKSVMFTKSRFAE